MLKLVPMPVYENLQALVNAPSQVEVVGRYCELIEVADPAPNGRGGKKGGSEKIVITPQVVKAAFAFVKQIAATAGV